jgi:hypothetical protein
MLIPFSLMEEGVVRDSRPFISFALNPRFLEERESGG